MKIVVLDGFAENPGDLSWDWLGEYGQFAVYERTNADQIYERSKDSDIILTNKTPLNEEILKKLNNLKFIELLSTGFNIIDIDYCKANCIPVSNIPTYSTEAVAQCVFAHILDYTNQVHVHSNSVHNGGWSTSLDFSYTVKPIYELNDKTIGIIGFGKIGKAVSKIAKSFGMNVLVYTNHPIPIPDVEFTDLDNLLKSSDFVTLHCPLTQKTIGLVNKDFLSKMKNTAMLINTSRGPVVDESALAQALKDGTIAAAGLDVMCKEPPEEGNPLFGLENCSITPHIAWAGFETRKRLMEICKENVKAFINGNPVNTVC